MLSCSEGMPRAPCILFMIVMAKHSCTSSWKGSIWTRMLFDAATYTYQLVIKLRIQASETATNDLTHKSSYDRLENTLGTYTSKAASQCQRGIYTYVPGTINRMFNTRYTSERRLFCVLISTRYLSMYILYPVKRVAARRSHLRIGRGGSRLPLRDNDSTRRVI